MNRRFHKQFRAVSCFGMFLAVAGCDEKLSISTVPASGTVTFNGQPVADASVVFSPLNEKGRSAMGTTDSAGRFSLQTPAGGANLLKGAMVGDYNVSVSKTTVSVRPGATPDADPSKMSPEERQKMMDKLGAPKSAADAEGSGTPESRMASAKTGGDLTFNLPARYADPQKSQLAASVKGGGGNDFKFELTD